MWVGLLEAPRRAPEEPGVYVIRWVRGGEPVRIPRLLGVDESGALYVGSTGNLRRRLRRLVRGLRRPGPKIHSAALSYYFFALHKRIEMSELEVAWVELGSRDEAGEQEWAALRSYAETYGEAPPLNRSLGRKKYLLLGIVELRARLAPRLDPRLAKLLGL